MNKDRSSLGSWLDRLQQESWQLELLISGFAIFLLLGGWEPFQGVLGRADKLVAESRAYFPILLALGMLSTAYLALLIALIIHVALRGLWIAAIGLRYVSGDIDYDALSYQPRFRQYLTGSVGSFDGYIERLERYCSVLFSVAFLIIFCFISVTTYFVFVLLLQLLYRELLGGAWTGQGVFGNSGILDLVFVLLGVIYLIDFFTLGFFKRNRHTARVYYPIYRFMGWVTLARFYRPLYHNLIDNRFGRKLAYFLPVAVIGMLLLVSAKIVTHDYFPYYTAGGRVWIDAYNYDDSEVDLVGQNWRVTLTSKYPDHGYVEAFAPYRSRYVNPVIERKFPYLPVSRYTGPGFGQPLQLGELYNRDVSHYDSLLVAFSSIFRLYVDDSLRTEVAPRFHDHPRREQPGLLFMVPVHGLPTGEHGLRLEQQFERGDTLFWHKHPTIYFYN